MQKTEEAPASWRRDTLRNLKAITQKHTEQNERQERANRRLEEVTRRAARVSRIRPR
jgi:hypothetical protein